MRLRGVGRSGGYDRNLAQDVQIMASCIEARRAPSSDESVAT